MSKKFWYLTKLSFAKKVKTKWFVITNIILLVVIVALLNISTIIEFFGGSFDSKIDVLVVDNAGVYDLFKANMDVYADEEDISVSLSDESVDEITTDLSDEEVVIVINSSDDEYLTVQMISNNKIDSLTYQIIQQALNSTKTTVGMTLANIDVNILANISATITIDRTILNDTTDTDENMDLVITSIFPTLILPFFMLITFLVQMVGGEICEEKTTRSMEIIIGNVSPKVHLLSKVLASNLFVIVQGLLLILYCLVGILLSAFIGGASITSSIDLSSYLEPLMSMGSMNLFLIVIPITIVLIILSFIAYALVAGVLASVTVNIEDFNQLQSPVVLISVVGYYLAIMAAMFDGSLFIRIVSYIPFLSVFISPTLFMLGQITIFDMIVSVIILILFVYVLLKVGLKVYKTGILNYSSGKVWRKLFNAIKS